MPKEQKLYIGLYNDCYGALLTEKQSEMIKLYYDMDLSLSEIAEQFSVSRQAVRDCIVRAESQLEQYERKLGFVEKLGGVSKRIGEILADETLAGSARSGLVALAATLEDF